MRLIDADYLKRMFDVACGTNREVFNIADSVYNFAIKTIDDAPTVERPTGEWVRGREISRTMIGDKVQHIDYSNYTCSKCSLVLDNLLYRQDGSPFYKFCPNCGAGMIKGAENESNTQMQ